jgi:hypothetical protein
MRTMMLFYTQITACLGYGGGKKGEEIFKDINAIINSMVKHAAKICYRIKGGDIAVPPFDDDEVLRANHVLINWLFLANNLHYIRAAHRNALQTIGDHIGQAQALITYYCVALRFYALSLILEELLPFAGWGLTTEDVAAFNRRYKLGQFDSADEIIFQDVPVIGNLIGYMRASGARFLASLGDPAAQGLLDVCEEVSSDEKKVDMSDWQDCNSLLPMLPGTSGISRPRILQLLSGLRHRMSGEYEAIFHLVLPGMDDEQDMHIADNVSKLLQEIAELEGGNKVFDAARISKFLNGVIDDASTGITQLPQQQAADKELEPLPEGYSDQVLDTIFYLLTTMNRLYVTFAYLAILDISEVSKKNCICYELLSKHLAAALLMSKLHEQLKLLGGRQLTVAGDAPFSKWQSNFIGSLPFDEMESYPLREPKEGEDFTLVEKLMAVSKTAGAVSNIISIGNINRVVEPLVDFIDMKMPEVASLMFTVNWLSPMIKGGNLYSYVLDNFKDGINRELQRNIQEAGQELGASSEEMQSGAFEKLRQHPLLRSKMVDLPTYLHEKSSASAIAESVIQSVPLLAGYERMGYERMGNTAPNTHVLVRNRMNNAPSEQQVKGMIEQLYAQMAGTFDGMCPNIPGLPRAPKSWSGLGRRLLELGVINIGASTDVEQTHLSGRASSSSKLGVPAEPLSLQRGNRPISSNAISEMIHQVLLSLQNMYIGLGCDQSSFAAIYREWLKQGPCTRTEAVCKQMCEQDLSVALGKRIADILHSANDLARNTTCLKVLLRASSPGDHMPWREKVNEGQISDATLQLIFTHASQDEKQLIRALGDTSTCIASFTSPNVPFDVLEHPQYMRMLDEVWKGAQASIPTIKQIQKLVELLGKTFSGHQAEGYRAHVKMLMEFVHRAQGKLAKLEPTDRSLQLREHQHTAPRPSPPPKKPKKERKVVERKLPHQVLSSSVSSASSSHPTPVPSAAPPQKLELLGYGCQYGACPDSIIFFSTRDEMTVLVCVKGHQSALHNSCFSQILKSRRLKLLEQQDISCPVSDCCEHIERVRRMHRHDELASETILRSSSSPEAASSISASSSRRHHSLSPQPFFAEEDDDSDDVEPLLNIPSEAAKPDDGEKKAMPKPEHVLRDDSQLRALSRSPKDESSSSSASSKAAAQPGQPLQKMIAPGKKKGKLHLSEFQNQPVERLYKDPPHELAGVRGLAISQERPSPRPSRWLLAGSAEGLPDSAITDRLRDPAIEHTKRPVRTVKPDKSSNLTVYVYMNETAAKNAYNLNHDLPLYYVDHGACSSQVRTKLGK